MKKIICLLMLLQGVLLMAQTETLVTINGKKVQINPNSLNTAANGLNGASGEVGLGGTLLKPTVITTTSSYTLALQGLQTGSNADNVLVADSNGVLKWVPRSDFAGDNLGNHTATQDLNMNSKNITSATNITATGTVTTANEVVTTKSVVQTVQIKAGTDASAPGIGSIAVSADVNGNVVWKTPASVISASQSQADWNIATTTDPSYIKNKPSIPAPDNLGNHIATQDLNMSTKNITAAKDITATGTVTTVNEVVTGKSIIQMAQIKAGTDASAPGIGSIAVSADTNGNVVWKTPASVISANQSQADWNMATTSDPSYIKNKPSIPAPDNLGNHIATQDLDMNTKSINNIKNAYINNDLQIRDRITSNTNYFSISKNSGLFQIWNGSKSLNDLTIDETTRKTTVNNFAITKGTDNSTPATGSIAVSADANGNVVWQTPASVISANQSQADWNMATTTDPSYIKNKPSIPAPDNLGNHIATQDLNMNTKNISAANNITATGTITGANVTATNTVTAANASVTTKTTTQTAAITKGTDNSIPANGSIAVSADTSGNIVWKTPASVISANQTQADWNMATTTDPSYIKNKPSIPAPDNLGNHIATTDLNMSLKSINNIKDAFVYNDLQIRDRNALNTNYFSLSKNNGIFQIWNGSKSLYDLTIDESTRKTTVNNFAITKGTDNSTPATGSIAVSADANGNVVWQTPASVISANQTQADWNMATTSDPSYIKNKPSIPAPDNLGNHIATQDLNMNTKNINAATNITATGTITGANVTATSTVTAVNANVTTKTVTQTAQIKAGTDASAPAIGSIAVSADVNGNVVWKTPASVISANQTQADWNMATTSDPSYIKNKPSIPAPDNLGNHIATQDLNMNTKNITTATNITATGTITGANVTASGTVTTANEVVTAKSVVQTAQIKAGTDASAPGIGFIAVSADTNGNVVWKTPASVISANQTQADWNMATTSDPSYIKNKPSIPAPDNLGNHIATQDLNMSSKNIAAAANITATGTITGANVTATNTVTTVNEVVTGKSTIQTAQIKAGTDASAPGIGSIAVSADTNGNVVWKTPASVISANQTQADWNMATTSDPSYIKNKPSIPAPDNLGNHIATQDLNMSSKNITAANNITAAGNVAIGVATATNPLHVKASSNPVRIEGLSVSSSTSDVALVVDANGVVKKGATPPASRATYVTPTLAPGDSYTINLAITPPASSFLVSTSNACGRNAVASFSSVSNILVLLGGVGRNTFYGSTALTPDGDSFAIKTTSPVTICSGGALGGATQFDFDIQKTSNTIIITNRGDTPLSYAVRQSEY